MSLYKTRWTKEDYEAQRQSQREQDASRRGWVMASGVMLAGLGVLVGGLGMFFRRIDQVRESERVNSPADPLQAVGD